MTGSFNTRPKLAILLILDINYTTALISIFGMEGSAPPLGLPSRPRVCGVSVTVHCMHLTIIFTAKNSNNKFRVTPIESIKIEIRQTAKSPIRSEITQKVLILAAKHP